MANHRVLAGVDNLTNEIIELLSKSRFGVLQNQASIDGNYQYTSSVLAARFPGKLAAIFSPQHGLFSEQQDNMIESPHRREGEWRVPVHSLYSETRQPTPAMLDGLEALVIDLQDVGTRVYTFVWTALYCVEACAERGIPLVVLDRPNPIGGRLAEGAILDPTFASFVGRAAVPMRHGLTIAELLGWVNRTWRIGARILVANASNWQRHLLWSSYSTSWVPTSPNMPRFEAAAVYPGQVLIEGTNLSEGRGTTTPFEICGAPFIEPRALVEALNEFALPGVVFRPIRFIPTFQKWKDQSCGGVFLHVVDHAAFRPYRTTVALFASIRRLYGAALAWIPPPYEYETVKMPIDILSGGSSLREAVDSDSLRTLADLDSLCALDESAWWSSVQHDLLYA